MIYIILLFLSLIPSTAILVSQSAYAQRENLVEIYCSPFSIRSIKLSHDNKFLVFYADNKIKILNLLDNQKLTIDVSRTFVSGIDISPNGENVLFSSTNPLSIEIWSIRGKKGVAI